MEQAHEFYAVTLNSVYYVTDQRTVEGMLHIERAGWPTGDRFSKVPSCSVGGRYASISRRGLVIYNQPSDPPPQPLWPPEKVLAKLGDAAVGMRTSSIVALFFSRREALTCFGADNRQQCDLRWRRQTEEVLTAIGDDHPVFVRSRENSITYT